MHATAQCDQAMIGQQALSDGGDGGHAPHHVIEGLHARHGSRARPQCDVRFKNNRSAGNRGASGVLSIGFPTGLRLVRAGEGRIEKITPTHTGPPLVRDRLAGRDVLPATATASSEAAPHFAAQFAYDDNYATRWSPAREAKGAWLQLDLGSPQKFSRQEIRFEYAWKPYGFTLQTSDDGRQWQTLAAHTAKPLTGSPIILDQPATARYLRLQFPADEPGCDISVFEWQVLP